MTKKVVWLMVSCLMVLSLVMASCGPKEEVVKEEPAKEEPAKEEPVKEEPVQKEEVGVPKEEVPWWEEMFGKPQYGGTITYIGGDVTTFDPSFAGSSIGNLLVSEPLTHDNYNVSKEVAETYIVGPRNVERVGWIAESWEQTGPLTWTVHIRKGVTFQNKPPVNGREFTAYDIEYYFHRQWGITDKYGAIPAGVTSPMPATVESVKAIDKYTLVWQFKVFSLDNEGAALAGSYFMYYYNSLPIVAPQESVKLWGDVNDWRRVIGTGPFMIKSYVTSSALTYEKNPNYWGYDERYPENKLPYADRVVALMIPDQSTQMAAIRTGKIDFKGYFAGGNINWETAANLKKTNPEIVQIPQPGSGGGFSMRANEKPFNDIRVRKAMQMAINLKELADTYYGGIPDGTPVGLTTPLYRDQVVPYEEWPQEVKDGFKYNPEGAKKLLAQAGYPNGFKTEMLVSPSFASDDLILILKAFLLEIGIEINILRVDPGMFMNVYRNKNWHAMTNFGITGSTMDWTVNIGLARSTEGIWNFSPDDPVYDAMYDKALYATTREEQNRLVRECFIYNLQQFWFIHLQPSYTFNIHQPWLKGYFREHMHLHRHCTVIPRWWIDLDLKKSMGY